MVESSIPNIDYLPDPLGDRQCPSVECPPNKPLNPSVLFPY
jgi:hypothetical protein